MLHARALEFPHPEGGTRRIETPWPADLIRIAGLAGMKVSPVAD